LCKVEPSVLIFKVFYIFVLDFVETKLVFGPLSWAIELQTTAVPDADLESLTEMPEVDAVATTAVPEEILLTTDEVDLEDDVKEVEEAVEIVVEDIKYVALETSLILSSAITSDLLLEKWWWKWKTARSRDQQPCGRLCYLRAASYPPAASCSSSSIKTRSART
jgi:hypothetical protein